MSLSDEQCRATLPTVGDITSAGGVLRASWSSTTDGLNLDQRSRTHGGRRVSRGPTLPPRWFLMCEVGLTATGLMRSRL